MTRKLFTVLFSLFLMGQSSSMAQVETLAQLQSRLVELKAEEAVITAKIAALSKPVSAPILPALLSKMPKELWPSTGDLAAKTVQRRDWLKANLAGQRVTLPAVEIQDSGGSGKQIYYHSKKSEVRFFGQNISSYLIIIDVGPEEIKDFVSVKVGDKLNLQGTIEEVIANGDSLILRIKSPKAY